jgi:hypothetical protein
MSPHPPMHAVMAWVLYAFIASVLSSKPSASMSRRHDRDGLHQGSHAFVFSRDRRRSA